MTAIADTKKNPGYHVIVPAAGVGRRMGGVLPKQYLPLLGQAVLEHTLSTLLKEIKFQRIIVAVAATDTQWKSLPVFSDSRIEVVEGGGERSQSVLNGLQHLCASCDQNDWVLVHDVARPCITNVDIRRMLEQLSDDAVGGILAIPVSDTIKQLNDSGTIAATIDRSLLWQAQTPQMFRVGLLRSAIQQGLERQEVITDEASAVELAGFSPKVVEGSRTNIKITRPEDLALAEYFLQRELSCV